MRLVIKSVALNCGMKLEDYRNDQSFLIALLAHAHVHTLTHARIVSHSLLMRVHFIN